jgi:predicted RNase H-like nuclease (RuvC/YqgF family)
MNHIPTCGELSCDQCNERTFALLSEREELRQENHRLKHRIELLEAANGDVHRIARERDAATERINRLERALQKPTRKIPPGHDSNQPQP